jgi:phosphopantetheine--protein transferase-like protein
MSLKSAEAFVNCYFLKDNPSAPNENLSVIDVFFARTKELSSNYPGIRNFFNSVDCLKADRFRSEDDRATYLYCHTLLRLFLSKRLGKHPDELTFLSGRFNKPILKGNGLHFNISHTRDSFAFAVSEHGSVGIDVEKTDRKTNFKSISKRFFSRDENEFISESADDLPERFFLLWTRKEALLKALGTGIINYPSRLEVFREKNFINMDILQGMIEEPSVSDYFIYSRKIADYYLSVAAPGESDIVIYQPEPGREPGENYLLSLLSSFK